MSAAVVDSMMDEIEKVERDLLEMKRAANTFARRAGVEEPYPEANDERIRIARVRPDQFFGSPAPSTAARDFLLWRGRERGSAPLEEIHAALKAGGYDFGVRSDADARSNLKTALSKDGQIYKLPNGTYGLRDWYNLRPEDTPKRKVRRPPSVPKQEELQVPSEEPSMH